MQTRWNDLPGAHTRTPDDTRLRTTLGLADNKPKHDSSATTAFLHDRRLLCTFNASWRVSSKKSCKQIIGHYKPCDPVLPGLPPALVLQATNTGREGLGTRLQLHHTHTQTHKPARNLKKSLRQQKMAAKTSTRAGQQPAWCSGYRTPYTPCCGWTWQHRVSDCACVVMVVMVVMVADGEGGRRHMWSSSINDRSSHSYCTQQTALIHVANSVLLSCEEI